MAGSLPFSKGLVVAALLSIAAPARADENASLEARVKRLEEQAAKNEAKPAAETARRPSAIVFSGFAHVDWVMFRQSSQNEITQDGEPLNENRFLVRRGRLRGESDRGYFHGAVEIEANTIKGPIVRPINVEASFKYPAERPYPSPVVDPALVRDDGKPWFIVTTGLFRTPYGFEVPEPENSRPWLERTTVSNALFPQSFDLGLRVLGGYRFARYSLGIMNGAPIGERAFPGRDPNESKDLVFRVGATTDVTESVHVEGGLSGLTGRGFHRGNPATKDQVVWRDLKEDTVIDPAELVAIAGSPASPSESFKRFAIGADLRASIRVPVLGMFGARFEITRASNLDRGLFFADPVVAGRDLREIGWYVGAHQEITKWAMVGVRYDRYDPDSDAREREPYALVPRSFAQSTWSFSAAGRLSFARLIAQYDLRSNALGRDANGAPATLKDDSFTLRAEVRF